MQVQLREGQEILASSQIVSMAFRGSLIPGDTPVEPLANPVGTIVSKGVTRMEYTEGVLNTYNQYGQPLESVDVGGVKTVNAGDGIVVDQENPERLRVSVEPGLLDKIDSAVLDDGTLVKQDEFVALQVDVTSQFGAMGMRSKSSRLLSTMLRSGQSFAVIGVGDSTMTLSTSWLGKLFTRIGAKWGYNVKHAQYNFGKTEYDAWTLLHSVGEDAHLRVNPSGSWYTTPVDCNVTSEDLHVEINVAMDNWAESKVKYMCGRSKTTGERGWGIYVTEANKIGLIWYPNGTNPSAALFNNVSTVDYVNGKAYWLKVTLDVDDDNGHYVARCYTSENGFLWTLAQTITGATITEVKNSTTERYYIGGIGEATGFSGKIYEVRIRNGIDGRIVNPQPVTTGWRPVQTGAYNGISVAGTPTIYVYNTAIGGFKEASYTDAIIDKSIINAPCTLVIESLGYNNTTLTGSAYLSDVTTLMDKLKNRLLYPTICMCSQAPTISPAEWRDPHQVRVSQITSYAHANGYDCIPFHDVIRQSGIDLSTIFNSDGLHPNSDGQNLLADIAERYFVVS